MQQDAEFIVSQSQAGMKREIETYQERRHSYTRANSQESRHLFKGAALVRKRSFVEVIRGIQIKRLDGLQELEIDELRVVEFEVWVLENCNVFQELRNELDEAEFRARHFSK